MTPFCTSGVWSNSEIANYFRFPIALADLWFSFLCNAGGGAFIIMFFGVCVSSFLEYLDLIGKKIAIAEKILNATFAAFVLPTILFSVVGIQIFSGFVSISRDSLIPMPQFLLFPLVWLNCTLFNMLVTTLSSYVYGNSNRIIGTLGELGCKLRFRIEYDQLIFWGHPVSTRNSTRVMLLFCQVFHISSIVCPLLIFALVLVKPCLPPFLGSMTHFCTAGVWSSSETAKYFRLILPASDLWMALLCDVGGGAFIIMFFGVCAASFFEYLDVIDKVVSSAKNSLNFWDVGKFDLSKVTEHGNLTRSNSPKLRLSLLECIALYRKVLVAEKMFNATFAPLILPVSLFCMTGIEIFSGFVSISRHSLIPMPQFMLYPLVWLNCTLFNLLATTLSSYVYENSNRMKEKLKELVCQVRFGFGRRLLLRELRSCTPLKIRFENNFIDGMTPLANQDLAVTQTMSLVLLGKS
ncbi:hypothetical protein Fcan01_16024 [Folsomia candida]|uniref:Uncharacterized protein n=1 Tax=Folsomia candida TaxID=158441 RepID=A0A226DUR8_FOLCA|nr:hypothetical protein Fcan01_16024 [Folsomia candida]